MLSIVAAALLASSGAEPVKLAATGLSGVGISEAQAEFFTEHLAEKLTAHGFAVVTPKEIATLLGMERQKQLLGCADDASSCVSEIANALGADGLVLGTIAKIGSAYQVDLKVLGAQNAKRLGSYSSKVRGEEEILEGSVFQYCE